MAVQLNYLAPKNWKPPKEYLITYLDIELADGIPEDKFADAAASCAAESSTGTWTKVYDGKDSGIPKAEELKAVAFDLNPENKTFKIAYKPELFEKDNMSGILAGVIGNIEGMKMLKAIRCLDIRFPEAIIKSFPGPAFGVQEIRKMLEVPEGPLLCTVPKPKLGRTAQEQAELAKVLFSAGDGSYNGLKDDENLTNLEFNLFEERCRLVHSVINEIEKKDGKKRFYFNNVTHSNIDTMLKRAELIKENGGRFLMIDCITTGFSAIHTMRLKNTGLAMHAHRAMHGLLTRETGEGSRNLGKITGFSMSMYLIAKIMRLLGIDSLHGGTPKGKMEDYDESLKIRDVLQLEDTPETELTLGQKWYGMKSVWHTASGGLHPGTIPEVMKKLGNDIVIQCGGGSLGHPDGISAGVEAIIESKNLTLKNIDIIEWVKDHPDTALARAIKHWGVDPKIVY